MTHGGTNSLDRRTLKRKYLECFNVRTTNAAAWHEVVTALVHAGVSRQLLVIWGVEAGYPRVTVTSLVSRTLCAIGLRQRRKGAGRKFSPDGVALYNYARRRYGERIVKVLRSALRVAQAKATEKRPFQESDLILRPVPKRLNNNCGTAIKRLTPPDRLQIAGANFKTAFTPTIEARPKTRRK